MGRYIIKARCTTKDTFDAQRHHFGELRRIAGDQGCENPEVYMSDDGTLILVTSGGWVSYLRGGKPPTEDYGALQPSDMPIEFLLE